MSVARTLTPVFGIKVASSPIHGKGIFAASNIPGGKIYLALKKVGNSGDPDKDWERTIIGRYANHSDAPNMDTKRVDNGIFLISKRPIKKGTELTVSYGAMEMSMSDLISGLAELSSPPPIRKKLLKIALDMVQRVLARDGIKAYVPKGGELSMCLNIDVKTKAEAALVATKLQNLFGMQVEKKTANGGQILFLPNKISVVVVPTKR